MTSLHPSAASPDTAQPEDGPAPASTGSPFVRPAGRRRRSLGLVGLLGLALVGATASLPAVAQQPGPDEEFRSQQASSSTTDSGVVAPAAAGGSKIMLDDTTRPVASGIDLRSVEWVDPQGYLRGDVLGIDLGAGAVKPDLIMPGGKVASAAPLKDPAEADRAVAAVNGDFFDINNSNAPLGAQKSREQGAVKGPNPDHRNYVGFTERDLGRITSVLLDGTVSTPGGTLPLKSLNQPTLEANGVGVFNSLWGDYSRAQTTAGAARAQEVIVADGVVKSKSDQPGAGQLAEGEVALVGRDGGADSLAALNIGDKVGVDYDLKTDGEELKTAIGANQVLVRDGKVQTDTDKALHPRTALGFNADGSKMWLVVMDGRIAESRGMSLPEMGAWLKDLGAVNAVNLDGGGSSTMLAREAGESDLDIENQPSDGNLRPVPNGLALHAKAGSGKLTDMRLTTESDEEDPELWKTFPGLTRELEALGFDESYAPVKAEARYRMRGVDGNVGRDGTVRPRHSGEATVTAQVGRLTVDKKLTVLGELQRLRADVDKVSIPDPAQPATFSLVGRDGAGFEAPIETADVKLDYDTSKAEITPTEDGRFSVNAKADSGSVVVKATVGKVTTNVPVAIGTEESTLANFDDNASWKFTQARAAGSVAPAEGHDGGNGLKMDFDFTQSTGTRVGYARPPQPLVLEGGQPVAIGAWVKGDGQNEWTSFGIQDGSGKSMSLYGPYIDWTGWKYVEVPIPQTLQGPIQLNFLAAIETKAARSYKGTVSFDDVMLKTAPEVQVPESPKPQDPVIAQHTGLDPQGKRWKFAVLSDGQFTAKNQSLVPAVRRTMAEIVAAEPEFVVINGDLVDEGAPEDFALARKVIDSELTAKGIPWYYVPGNHEIAGPGNTSNFKAEFGDTHRTFDHNGTRFVLLDSSTSVVRGGGFDQLQMLRSALDGAKADPKINGVTVMWHHPPRDPGPLKNSQMGDRVEAQMVEDWLGQFRLDSGKGAAFIGSHVGSFSADTVNAVPYLINGNSGKTPSAIPAEGGFSGWSLLGIDPSVKEPAAPGLYGVDPAERAKTPWLRSQVNPHVDELKVEAPALAVGKQAEVKASLVQWENEMALTYPMSAIWTGEGVFVGAADAAPADAVAAYDPATRQLTGLKGGTGKLTLKVNDKVKTVDVTVG